MHDGRLRRFDSLRCQPLPKGDHARIGRGNAGCVLPGPECGLAFEISIGATEVRQADPGRINPRQIGQHAVHRIIDRFPLRHLWQGRVPENTALQMLHDIKIAAHRVGLLIQQDHPGHRHGTA